MLDSSLFTVFRQDIAQERDQGRTEERKTQCVEQCRNEEREDKKREQNWNGGPQEEKKSDEKRQSMDTR